MTQLTAAEASAAHDDADGLTEAGARQKQQHLQQAQALLRLYGSQVKHAN